MTRAALYFRQSLDVQEGIERQRERCTALATAKGWSVDPAHIYADNDVSAGKTRGPKTGWGRMLKSATAKEFDVVVAVDMDRLLRSMRDLVTIVDTGIKIATIDGAIDTTTADGIFRSQMLASVAEFEINRKSERQKRATADNRTKGRPPQGRRAFGYTGSADGHVPKAPEAQAVREGFTLAAQDTPLAAIARLWNEQGLLTTSKAPTPWTYETVRAVLTNPRYAAKVAPPRQAKRDGEKPGHGGNSAHRFKIEELTDGDWEALVPYDLWLSVQTILRNPLRRISTSTAQRLLSGFATCGICGEPIRSGATGGVRNYRCSGAPHMARKAETIEEYIIGEVLGVVDRGGVGILYHNPGDAAEIRRTARELKARETDIGAMMAEGLMSGAVARPALASVRAQIAELEMSAVDNTRGLVLGPLVSAGATREAWDAMPMDQRRAAVALLADVSVTSPGRGKHREPVSESVSITWKYPSNK